MVDLKSKPNYCLKQVLVGTWVKSNFTILFAVCSFFGKLLTALLTKILIFEIIEMNIRILLFLDLLFY